MASFWAPHAGEGANRQVLRDLSRLPSSRAEPLPVRHRGDARGNHGALLHDRMHLPTYLHENAATGAHVNTNLQQVAPQPIPEPYIPPSPTRPDPPTQEDVSAVPGRLPAHSPAEDSPLRDQDPQPRNVSMPIPTVQHMSRPPTTQHVPDNYQLPVGGNHTRRTAPTRKLPTGTIDWKEILPGMTTADAMHLITPDWIKLPPAEHHSPHHPGHGHHRRRHPALEYSHIGIFLHSRTLHIIFTWIKGHADVPGNNYSDAISKWASYSINYPAGSHQPGSDDFIYHQYTPLPGNVSLKSLNQLLPAHSENNIHLSMSRDIYSHTSWFSLSPLKWVNGLYSCTGYQPHYFFNKYLSSKCLLKPPLDPITAGPKCTATDHLRQAIINAWPPPFNRLISDCWTTATPGDRRNFIHTVIPHSLMNILRSPLPALS